MEDVKKALEDSILECTKKASKNHNAIEVMQFTQAACNAANALCAIMNCTEKH